MPINIVYEDPEVLGESTRDAYGLRRRRQNLGESIDRQLSADQANAKLGLDYEQLYGGMAERQLDRGAQLWENDQNRRFQAERQQATDRADLRRLEAQTAAQERLKTHELNERQRLRRERDEAALERLEQERAEGKWDGREADFERERQRILDQKNGVRQPPRPVPPPARPPAVIPAQPQAPPPEQPGPTQQQPAQQLPTPAAPKGGSTTQGTQQQPPPLP